MAASSWSFCSARPPHPPSLPFLVGRRRTLIWEIEPAGFSADFLGGSASGCKPGGSLGQGARPVGFIFGVSTCLFGGRRETVLGSPSRNRPEDLLPSGFSFGAWSPLERPAATSLAVPLLGKPRISAGSCVGAALRTRGPECRSAVSAGPLGALMLGEITSNGSPVSGCRSPETGSAPGAASSEASCKPPVSQSLGPSPAWGAQGSSLSATKIRRKPFGSQTRGSPDSAQSEWKRPQVRRPAGSGVTPASMPTPAPSP